MPRPSPPPFRFSAPAKRTGSSCWPPVTQRRASHPAGGRDKFFAIRVLERLLPLGPVGKLGEHMRIRVPKGSPPSPCTAARRRPSSPTGTAYLICLLCREFLFLSVQHRLHLPSSTDALRHGAWAPSEDRMHDIEFMDLRRASWERMWYDLCLLAVSVWQSGSLAVWQLDVGSTADRAGPSHKLCLGDTDPASS